MKNIIEQLCLELQLSMDVLPYSLNEEVKSNMLGRIPELCQSYPGQLEERQRVSLAIDTRIELFNLGFALFTIKLFPSVSHIYVRSWELIYAEHCGRMDKIDIHFESVAHMRRTINNLVYPQALTSDSPFVSRDLSELIFPESVGRVPVFKGWITAFLNPTGDPALVLTVRKPPDGDDRLAPVTPSGEPAKNKSS